MTPCQTLLSGLYLLKITSSSWPRHGGRYCLCSWQSPRKHSMGAEPCSRVTCCLSVEDHRQMEWVIPRRGSVSVQNTGTDNRLCIKKEAGLPESGVPNKWMRPHPTHQNHPTTPPPNPAPTHPTKRFLKTYPKSLSVKPGSESRRPTCPSKAYGFLAQSPW